MMAIFLLSTDLFSPRNTSSIMEPILRFLMPASSEQGLSMAHGLLRKFGHLLEYFVLGLLLFRAFRGDSRELRVQQWILSTIVLILFAASDEFLQSLAPARTASAVDVVIDITGGILALVFGAFCYYVAGKVIRNN